MSAVARQTHSRWFGNLDARIVTQLDHCALSPHWLFHSVNHLCASGSDTNKTPNSISTCAQILRFGSSSDTSYVFQSHIPLGLPFVITIISGNVPYPSVYRCLLNSLIGALRMHARRNIDISTDIRNILSHNTPYFCCQADFATHSCPPFPKKNATLVFSFSPFA